MNRKTRNVIDIENNQSWDENDTVLNKSFSNLLANFNRSPSVNIYEDNVSDSDDPFINIKTSKNINFSRSRSHFDEEFNLLPKTPAQNQTGNENIPHISSEKRYSLQKGIYHRDEITSAVTRTPLGLKTYNSPTLLPDTPILKDKSFRHKVYRDSFEIQNLKYKDNKSRSIQNNVPKSSINASRIVLQSTSSDRPFCCTPTDPSQNLSGYSNNLSSEVIFSTANSINFLPDSSTPTNKRATPQNMSSFKRYSLKKAALAATKDFESMLKAATIKKRCNLNNKKNDSQCKLSSSLTPKNSKLITDEVNQKSKCCTKLICSPKQTFKKNSDNSSTVYCSSVNINASLSNHDNSDVETTPLRNNIRLTEFASTSRPSCCKSSLKTPSIIELNMTNKTPISTREKDICVPFTGIKRLESVPNKISSPRTMFSRESTKDFVNKTIENDDDDLPPTQPVSSTILHGVVAYVEIRSGREYLSEGTKSELQSLGAKIENNFTRKVTHCFFHGGKMSTYRRAIEWKVPLVSTLWIEACRAELRKVPLEGHLPHGLEKYKENLPLYKLKSKMRRPMTDSKVPAKQWKRNNEADKAAKVADNIFQPILGASNKTDELIDALHSVAGDMRKATDQFEQILTSPILQNSRKLSKTSVPKRRDNTGRRNSSKKLLVSTRDECNEQKNKSEKIHNDSSVSVINFTNDSVSEIRISYDSDDLLVYAKKQAASIRCSAPARLLTSRKCKKLLSSCNEAVVPDLQKCTHNGNVDGFGNQKKKSNAHPTMDDKRDANTRYGTTNDLKNKPKTRKRKLLQTLQVITTFEQDSGESNPDLSPICPYVNCAEPGNKKQKKTHQNKSAFQMMVKPVTSDVESDDSLTRAARRESSALFVKKQKKLNSQRYTPTLVCTSLPRSDVQVIISIASKLGRFTVEAAVSDRTSHVVTCSPRRTINLLKGIARGCWILNVQWVYESLEAGKWLHEEKFELTDFSPSVQQARIERQAFGPEFSLELFKGVGAIYVCRMTSPPANHLIELIQLCGGTVVSSARAAKIIIGTAVPYSPAGRHPLLVKEKWVLDSITKLSQLNPYDYVSVDRES